MDEPSPTMSRLRQLRRNCSGFELFRLVFVGLLFVTICVVMLVQTGEPAPLLCLLVGASVPMLFARRLTDNPEWSSRAGRIFGYSLVGTSMAFGLVKERVDQVVPGWLLVTGLALAIRMYLSFYVVLFSDPSLVRVRK